MKDLDSLGPANLFNLECECGASPIITREGLRYWPDALWPGKIQAQHQCHKCKTWSWMWAHELPKEWHDDWLKFNWEHNMRRLLFSLELHKIEPIPGLCKPVSSWQRLKCWFSRRRKPTPEILCSDETARELGFPNDKWKHKL